MDKVIYHHGILGMKWGVRRYQNPDGSLTSAGRKRHGTLTSAVKRRYKNPDGSVKSHETRSAERKLNKALKRGDDPSEAQKQLDFSLAKDTGRMKFDRQIREYRQAASLGSGVIDTLLVGPYANELYAAMRMNNVDPTLAYAAMVSLHKANAEDAAYANARNEFASNYARKNTR